MITPAPMTPSTRTHQSAPVSIVHEWDKLCVTALRSEHTDHGVSGNNPLRYGRFDRDYVDCPRCKAELALQQAVTPQLLYGLLDCFYAANFVHRHRNEERQDGCQLCDAINLIKESDTAESDTPEGTA